MKDVVTDIKKQVNTSNESITRTITEQTSSLNTIELSKMPSFESIRDNATRVRNKRDSYDFIIDHDILLRFQKNEL